VDGGQQKHVTHPTLWMVGNKNTLLTLHLILIIGGQQKPVTHPTFNFNYWWATKTRYPPYIVDGGQQKHVTGPLQTTLHHSPKPYPLIQTTCFKVCTISTKSF